MSIKIVTIEELFDFYHQVAQEIAKRGGSLNSYAAPHVWNLVAKIIRESANDYGDIEEMFMVENISNRFADRFEQDEGFNREDFLRKCEP